MTYCDVWVPRTAEHWFTRYCRLVEQEYSRWPRSLKSLVTAKLQSADQACHRGVCTYLHPASLSSLLLVLFSLLTSTYLLYSGQALLVLTLPYYVRDGGRQVHLETQRPVVRGQWRHASPRFPSTTGRSQMLIATTHNSMLLARFCHGWAMVVSDRTSDTTQLARGQVQHFRLRLCPYVNRFFTLDWTGKT